MARKIKEEDFDFYYKNNGQDIEEQETKKKRTEREKRIKSKRQESNFDTEDETVIQMTNKNNLKKEDIRRKKEQRNKRKKEKRIRRIKIVIEIIIFLGAIAGSSIFAMTSPIFNIKDIKVSNNQIVSSEEIISLSELKSEENIFKFNKNITKEKIKENAYIDTIKIHRKLPSTLEIEVTEREPKFSVEHLGKYAYISTQGYILEISEDSKGLVIIQGVTTEEEDVVAGKRLNNHDLVALETVIKIMYIIKENNLEGKVNTIDISDKNDYILYMSEEKKRIHLGDNSNLGNKMLYAISIMEKEKNNEGDIYVNGDLNNKFRSYFRQKV